MIQKPQSMMIHLLKDCIDSKLDLITFSEEFCFHYLYLDQNSFKSTCTPLYDAALDYLLSNSSIITPETILEASNYFSLIKSTYQSVTLLIH